VNGISTESAISQADASYVLKCKRKTRNTSNLPL